MGHWYDLADHVPFRFSYPFGCGGTTSRDLGQTYEANPKAQAVLYVGDLSYAVLITAQTMTMSGGIHGVDLSREELHINHGFGHCRKSRT